MVFTHGENFATTLHVTPLWKYSISPSFVGRSARLIYEPEPDEYVLKFYYSNGDLMENNKIVTFLFPQYKVTILHFNKWGVRLLSAAAGSNAVVDAFP